MTIDSFQRKLRGVGDAGKKCERRMLWTPSGLAKYVVWKERLAVNHGSEDNEEKAKTHPPDQ